MKRIKELVEKFKELWKVPRYRGLMKLAFWFLFFAIIIVILKIKGSIQRSIDEIKKESTSIETRYNDTINSYLYNYQINDGTNIIDISGTYYNGIDVFNFNNRRYYFKDNRYYLFEDRTMVDFNIWMNEFQYQNIANLVKDKEYESKTEYKDGIIEKVYIFDGNSYNNFYQKDYIFKGNIIIKIKENGKYYTNVVIDYSNYLVDYDDYHVSISYSNINNIDDFEKEKLGDL